MPISLNVNMQTYPFGNTNVAHGQSQEQSHCRTNVRGPVYS